MAANIRDPGSHSFTRCAWVGDDPLYLDYHDQEWGVPVHDDRLLFEFLVLEGAQAGLSWLTILRKRGNYREAFGGFDPEVVAGYGEDVIERLLADPGIVRNRLKIESAVANARAFLRVQEECGSFDAYVWGFVDGRPLRNSWRTHGGDPSPDSRVGAPEQGSQASRLQFRGAHHLLRAHAGHRHGERPHGGLLPVPEVTPLREEPGWSA